MNIGAAARASGVSAKMIRYYESIGLIPDVGRSAAGYRVYGQEDVHTLTFISRARDLGFSVAEMGELLALWRDQSRASGDVKAIALKHVAELEDKARALQAMSRTLRHLAENCHGDHRPHCPILADLAAPATTPAPARRLAAREPGGVAQRFLDGKRPSLEAQLCNLADEMAYNLHDIDDGVRSGLLAPGQLDAVELFARCREQALERHPALGGRRLLFETLRSMLELQVDDVVAASRLALDAAAPDSADAARCLPVSIRFGEGMQRQVVELKRLLFERLYRHPQVVATTDRARHVVAVLFGAYRDDPAQMPGRAPRRLREVADYIAGMTDRYASREYERLTGEAAFG